MLRFHIVEFINLFVNLIKTRRLWIKYSTNYTNQNYCHEKRDCNLWCMLILEYLGMYSEKSQLSFIET